MIKKIVRLIALISSDTLSFLSSLYLAYLLRKYILSYIHVGFQIPTFPFLQTYIINYPYFLPLCFIILAYEGLYSQRFSSADELKHLWRGASISFIMLIVLTFVTHTTTAVSRTVILLAWMLSLFIFPTLRSLIKRLLFIIHLWQKNLLIVGTGEMARFISRRIHSSKILGYQIAGFVEIDENKPKTIINGVRILGYFKDIKKIVQQTSVKDIVIAAPELSRRKLLNIVTTCEGAVENIRIVPDLFGVTTVGVKTEYFGGLLLLNLEWKLIFPWNVFLKRLVDIVLSCLGLIILSPLFLIVILAIRWETGSPVMFSQKRLGKNNGQFYCLKFRTMYHDAQEKLQCFLKNNPQAKEEWRKYAKLRSCDPRVTRVGKFLRRGSLDELPQLINVLRGEMSLAGPRPYLPREVQNMGFYINTILKAAPGMTGLWQVSGRAQLPFAERLKLEEYYVRNWSPWLDLIIMFRTIKVIFKKTGAA